MLKWWWFTLLEQSAISGDAYPMYMLSWGGLVFTEDIKSGRHTAHKHEEEGRGDKR